MKNAKRIISILLAVSMLLGLQLPSVFALKSDNSGSGEAYVFFETDFEKDTVGELPKGFSNSVATKTSVIDVVEDEGTKAMRYHRAPEEEKVGGPRVDYILNLRTLKEFDIDYDVKMVDAPAQTGDAKVDVSALNYSLVGTESNATIATFGVPCQYEKWTHTSIHVDLENLSATIYADGKEYKNVTLKEFTDAEAYVRFASLVQPNGGDILVDNIKIATKQKDYDPNASLYIDPKTIDAPYNRKDEWVESGDLAVIVDEDFESQAADALVKATPKGFKTFAVTEIAPIRVREKDGNKYAVAYHGDPVGNPATRGPRMGKSVSTEGLNTFTVDMDVKTENPGSSKIGINLFDTATNKYFVSVNLPSAFKDWTHIKVRFDFVNETAKVFVAGRLYKEYKAVMTASTMDIRIIGSIPADGSDWLVDNVLITTPDKDAGGYMSLSGEFVVEKLALDPAEELGMTKVMRTSHPRIFVHDWQVIRDRINTDSNYQIWYKNLINSANNALKAPATEYSINERGNINEDSTAAKDNLITLAGAYNLTGDVRYKDRLWQELKQVGDVWPDWDAKTYLCAAHVILGVAIAYDWVYNDWTPAEREQIEEWLIQKGMSQAVLAYEGQLEGRGNWIGRWSNWVNVCNGSNMIAALALADKYPRLAEYIFVKGDAALRQTFVEVSADGAYAETVGYWDYGMRHQVKLMAALETCLADGQALPAQLDYTDIRGFDKTGDFSIYYNGTEDCFNFGDGESGFSTTPIMYWLATKYDKPQYAWYDTYVLNSYEGVKHPSGRTAMWALLWYDPAHTATADPTFSLDKFYSSAEQLDANGISMRGSWTDQETMVVMAHGGWSLAGHTNHDAGGFVLDWAGHRWVHMYGRNPGKKGNGGMVYGWPSYHAQKEQGGHFDYYHTRGEANNTIIANPQQDMPDMTLDYHVQVVRSESAANTAYGILDMTPTNKDYIDAKRGFMLTDMRETLVIQDEIKANKPSEFYWFANTLADITLASDGKSALLEMDGDQMLVRITQGPADAKIGIMEAKPLPTSPNPAVQAEAQIEEEKLFIHMENVQDLNLTVEFVPLHEGEGIPAAQPVKPLSAWSVEGSPEFITSQKLGDIVALKVDNPNAYAKGAKTYVDTANLDIKPIVQNGRTLVPVRFIAEKFGASVGWEERTQTVTVKTDIQDITLQLGSNQMMVNGNAITLDVPAQEIGGRTLIPLRALVEALGKQVFWDDRGLIVISNAPVNYDADTISKIIDLLDIRVQINGKELKYFDSEVYDYYYTSELFALPTVTASSTKAVTVTPGNPTVVTVGDKNYNIHFVENTFAGVGGGPEAIRKFVLTPDNGQMPTTRNFLPIVSATSSIEFSLEKYPMNGTYDNVIHDTITQHRWSANGLNHWIAYDFGEEKNLHSFSIAGFMSDERSYTWEVATSNDGVNWTVVNPGATTTLGSVQNVFKLNDVKARYVRLTGVAAVNTTWLGICEVRFYESAAQEEADQATWFAEFMPTKVAGRPGETRKIIIQGINGYEQTVTPDASTYTIVSSDPSVATVDAMGNVQLVATGKAKITLSSDTSGVTRTYTIEVNVI